MSIDAEHLSTRLWAKDATLWPQGNASPTRLGWLDVPRQLEREARELTKWAATIDQEVIVLLGMGGSSLGAGAFDGVGSGFGEIKGRRIFVCDTTDPTTIVNAPLEDAFILVSSKSGTTLEVESLFSHARSRVFDPRRYAVITDPGTPLGDLGSEFGVNRIFLNPADIGGRYSVLSYFGLVPAVLAGYDVEELCGRAMETDRLQAVQFGIDLATAALEGKDKATIVTHGATRWFGLWAEQLIAESTGKQGRGIVPVPTPEPESGEDRYTVDVELNLAHELGSAFYRFEIAIAIAGHVLGIDPFNEPNVAESKTNTARILSALPLPDLASSPPESVKEFLSEELKGGDYLSIQAYLSLGQDAALEFARTQLRDRHDGIAVTAGYGPRFLHSTGQLHKGGPNSIVAIQLVPRDPEPELGIPDKPYDFSTLKAAQAIGDFESLRSHGRRVLRVGVKDLEEFVQSSG